MSEKKTQRTETAAAARPLEARHGSAFWNGVEREVEVLDVADLEQFMAADRLAIEPGRDFAEQLRGYLRGLVRRRFSH